MNEVILNVSTDEDAEVLKSVAGNGGLLKILRSVAKSDVKFSEVLAKAGLSEDATTAVKTALKALESVKGELPEDIIKTLADMAGYKYPEEPKEPDAAMESKAKGDPALSEDEACKAVMKADGSLDSEKIPVAMRPFVELLWKQNRANTAALATSEAVLKQERDERKMKEFIAKAADLKHLSVDPARFGPVLKSASEAMPTAMYEELDRVLKAADKGMSASFKELGSAGGDLEGDRATATDQLTRKAEEIRKRDGGKITIEQAFLKALDEHPDLAKKERQEREVR